MAIYKYKDETMSKKCTTAVSVARKISIFCIDSWEYMKILAINQ